MAARELNRQDLLDLARGAAFLGTGGGGDPYIGRLMAERALSEGYRIELLPLDDVPDDWLVIPTAIMGAPTVMIEKIPSDAEALTSLRALEQHLGRRADATMPIECGGINSTVPLVVGARAGLPVIDADGMGRAFPELQMETFHVHGVSGTPMAISNEHAETAVLTTRDNASMEWLARGMTIRMGGAAMIAEYSMSGADARRSSVPGTISLGIELGRCIREARQRHDDPFEALIAELGRTIYGYARVIYTGKVADVCRVTTGGFATGTAEIISEAREPALELRFQNEHLIALVDGEVRGIVPDLICVLDADTAEPITTEALRYGQRVRVMVVATPDIMRTRKALEVFGPRAFGIDRDFTGIETLSE